MTQLLSFDASGFQFAWDSTSLGTFQTCPRKYFYGILQGWTASERSVHLEFGGHYAKALERFHKFRAAGLEYADAVRGVLRLLMIETWEHDLVEENALTSVGIEDGAVLFSEEGEGIQRVALWRMPGTGRPVDWGHNTKTRDTLVRSVVWYLHQFENDPMTTVILANGAAAVEYSFSFELSEDYLYCGHIDRLVHYGEDKDVYVQDQKTSGSTITPRYFKAYSPDIQMTGYTLAGTIGFNLPVKGVVIDAAQIAVGFTKFERGVVLRHKTQLEEFREEALAYIAEAKRCHETGYYPMRRPSCGNYGGCEFQNVCALQPILRERFLEGNFKKRKRWDPLERR